VQPIISDDNVYNVKTDELEADMGNANGNQNGDEKHDTSVMCLYG
jgi:hypothetical protein